MEDSNPKKPLVEPQKNADADSKLNEDDDLEVINLDFDPLALGVVAAGLTGILLSQGAHAQKVCGGPSSASNCGATGLDGGDGSGGDGDGGDGSGDGGSGDGSGSDGSGSDGCSGSDGSGS